MKGCFFVNIILDELLDNRDLGYKDFHKRLIPTIDEDTLIGVRSPIAQAIAKKYANTDTGYTFLNSLPHKYYDENIVHAFMLGKLKCDTDTLKGFVSDFLPYVDNWAVCDGLCSHLKGLFKNKDNIYPFVLDCIRSGKPYTVRFGLVCLLNYYIDSLYIDRILEIAKSIKSDEYYINMALAWLISFCIIKEYDKTLVLLEGYCLDKWVHNKSIQKSIESYRISDDKKQYLKSLRIK